MKSVVCITDVVRHMYNESARVMEGTVHEDSWYFYNSVLSLMTSVTCKKWMQKEGLLYKWLLPLQGLNEGTRYENTPIGNLP